jgi:hypothetical protein
VLTPLELIDRLAALAPPPRTHRHRYFGVLAPHSPLRAVAVTLAQAAPALTLTALASESAAPADSEAVSDPGSAGTRVIPAKSPETASRPRASAHTLWAMLIARIYEVLPLVCPLCGGQMRLIAFIIDGHEVGKILENIGVDAQPPRITPARGPPLWDEGDA